MSYPHRMVRALACVLFALALIRVAPATAEPEFAAAGDEMVALLQEAVRFDTSNPPGKTDAIALFYAEKLEEAGLEPEFFTSEDGQVHVVARLKGDGSAEPLLLLNHMDVVGADRAEWAQDPWAADIVDGKLYGRGTLDMKGLGVMQLQVMRLLARDGFTGKRDIIFYGAPDEEAGGARGAGWMTENHWDQVQAEYVLTEGASGRRDAFGEGSRVYFVQTGEKGVCWLEMTAHGTSGHGSRPTWDNANVHLIRALERLADYRPAVRLVPTVVKSLRQLAPVVGGETGALWARAGDPAALPALTPTLLADKMFNPIVRTTINITNLASGFKVNVVPATATAKIDCRILPGTTPDALLADLTAQTRDPEIAEWEEQRAAELGRPLEPEERRQVQFDWIIRGEATESSIESPVYDLIEAVLGAADPGVPLVPRLSAGGTDARFWRQRGVDAYGFAPFMLTEEQHATVHGKDEHIEVEEYKRGLPIYYEIVKRAAETGS